MIKTRSYIAGYIQSNGQEIERYRTWEEAEEAEKNALLKESTSSGYSTWFSIIEDKSIWWVYSDSSDGGTWSTNSIKITGYRMPYESEMAEAINNLIKELRTKKLAKNSYAQIK